MKKKKYYFTIGDKRTKFIYNTLLDDVLFVLGKPIRCLKFSRLCELMRFSLYSSEGCYKINLYGLNYEGECFNNKIFGVNFKGDPFKFHKNYLFNYTYFFLPLFSELPKLFSLINYDSLYVEDPIQKYIKSHGLNCVKHNFNYFAKYNVPIRILNGKLAEQYLICPYEKDIKTA